MISSFCPTERIGKRLHHEGSYSQEGPKFVPAATLDKARSGERPREK
jgi:hypothetical protein